MMTLLSPYFSYKDKTLSVEDVSLHDLAKTYGTPFYVYSASHIKGQIRALHDAFSAELPAARIPRFSYATKANSNVAVLRAVKAAGGYLEVVSEGELYRGLKAGFKGDDIVMTGIGKQDSEIRACLEAGIHQINVEAIEELSVINEIAGSLDRIAPIAFRLNPDVAAGGDDKIMTGRARDKFGLGPDRIMEAFEAAKTFKNLKVVGLSMHIGSQIHEVWLFRKAYTVMAQIVESLRAHGHTIERLDIGGGFGIRYQNEQPLPASEIAKAVSEIIEPLGTEIIMEPGRFVVGNAGLLVSNVITVKKTTDKTFLVCDFAMNDLIRPTLYDAWHSLVPVTEPTSNQTISYDIVGPVCETGDTFARERQLPPLSRGDLIAVQSAGAYTASMASNYNTRCFLPEILVEGTKAHLIRKRQSYDDLLNMETDAG